MNEFMFADVAHAEQHVCLTLPLRDYCIGHRLLFMHQRNPLVFGDEKEFDNLPLERRIFWLIESVTVCNQSYASRVQFEKYPTRWTLWKFKRDSKRWRKARDRAKAAFKNADEYWTTEIAAFRNYLGSSRIITSFKHKRESWPFMACGPMPDAKGRSLGGPYDATLIQFLIGARFCPDVPSAMEYPFALAEIHYLTHLEREGSIKILNDEELEFKTMCELRDIEAAQQAGFKTVEEHVAHITGNAQRANAEAASKAGKTGLATELPTELTK